MTKAKAVIAGLVAIAAVGVALVLLLPREALAQGKNATPLMTVSCDSQECSFGDLAADAVRAAGGADIAFVGAISFRPGVLTPGDITVDRVSTMLANPSETWAVSRLTGAQIRAALEHAVRTAPLPNNAFLQVAGLSFDYKMSAPQHQRVQAIRVGFGTLADGASYTVAMPLSLAKGGSGYFKIFTKEAIIRQGDTGLADATVAFAQRQGTVTYTGMGRINAVP